MKPICLVLRVLIRNQFLARACALSLAYFQRCKSRSATRQREREQDIRTLLTHAHAHTYARYSRYLVFLLRELIRAKFGLQIGEIEREIKQTRWHTGLGVVFVVRSWIRHVTGHTMLPADKSSRQSRQAPIRESGGCARGFRAGDSRFRLATSVTHLSAITETVVVFVTIARSLFRIIRLLFSGQIYPLSVFFPPFPPCTFCQRKLEPHRDPYAPSNFDAAGIAKRISIFFSPSVFMECRIVQHPVKLVWPIFLRWTHERSSFIVLCPSIALLSIASVLEISGFVILFRWEK